MHVTVDGEAVDVVPDLAGDVIKFWQHRGWPLWQRQANH